MEIKEFPTDELVAIDRMLAIILIGVPLLQKISISEKLRVNTNKFDTKCAPISVVSFQEKQQIGCYEKNSCGLDNFLKLCRFCRRHS